MYLDFSSKRLRKRNVSLSVITGSVCIDSESNIVTVIPDRNYRDISYIQKSEYKIEVNLSNEQIQEITNNFSTEMENNVITGDSAVTIIDRYLKPVMESSGMDSIIQEICDHFKTS
jgi:hypothetical protein